MPHPSLVTEDRQPKPYQNTNIRYERDKEEEEDETWDDDNNPNKRSRDNEIRRQKPSKRRKPNKPEDKTLETEEDKKEKIKPVSRLEDRPTKTRKL